MRTNLGSAQIPAQGPAPVPITVSAPQPASNTPIPQGVLPLGVTPPTLSPKLPLPVPIQQPSVATPPKTPAKMAGLAQAMGPLDIAAASESGPVAKVIFIDVRAMSLFMKHTFQRSQYFQTCLRSWLASEVLT
jgi:hypothetical protein